MPPKKGKESVQRKSAAEFFTENQTIAGFDNPGKSLYTTIRELVENSLDAAESIGEPPDVALEIRELSQAELDAERGVLRLERVDETLFEGRGKADDKEKTRLFYRVTCRDNGCGVHREAIPDAFGRVLAGSKYGARQARGKFGLGAKMALIWGKKSSGLPLTVRTARAAHEPVSRVVLDIDIQRNEPRVLEDSVAENSQKWRGAELTVTVGGNWKAYRARIVQYLRQLAIITPYASLRLDFRGSGSDRRDVRLEFARRTTKVPPVPRATGYHPAALDELLLEQLLRKTAQPSLGAFCRHALQGGPPALMRRVLKEGGFDERTEPLRVADDAARLRRLARLFRDVNCFAPPDASGLAPVGEYNLRLGVEKEVRPTYVATACSPVAAHEGHAFVVEAAVSVGGLREEEEGLRVYRFANRIPLLFEAGADVVTRVAKTKVKWGAYKIDLKKEKVGIFVSLVSTKIPFKGTSKEYIGEDATDIHDAIKAALCQCGLQLKAQLVKRDQARQGKDRKKNLLRYVPDVAAALWKVLGPLEGGADAADAKTRGDLRRRLGACGDVSREDLGEAGLVAELRRNVDAADLDAVAASFQDASASKKRVDMRRRAAREDAVGEHFALRLFVPNTGPPPPESDSDGPAPRRAAKAPAPKSRKLLAGQVVAPKKPAAAKKAPAAKQAPPKSKKSVDWTKDLDSDSEDAAPAPKAAFSFDDSDDSDVLAFDSRSPVKPKKPAAKRKPAGSDDDSDDGVNAKLQAKKRKTEAAVDSDSDDDASDDDGAPVAPRRPSGRSRKQISYADDDDDDADVEPDDDDEEEWN